LILATGGPGMVKAAYSSGKPALGVGAGNVPAVMHKSTDVPTAVNSVIVSKTFDNGVICCSEQSVIVDASIYDAVRKEFALRGCHLLNADELEKVRKTIVINGALNTKIVGQSAEAIAEMAGVKVPKDTKILIGEVESVDNTVEEFAREKLSPVLAMYKYQNFDEAVEKAHRLITDGGYGHTSAIYINPREKEDLSKFENALPTCRVLVNTPSSHGGIGDLYNFKLAPSLTLGCGSWGGNSVSENVGPKHLLNIKSVAERRENMLWFRTPPRVYFKKGCFRLAMSEFKNQVFDYKKVFVVTDEFLHKNDYVKPVTQFLDEAGISYSLFSDVQPDPTLKSVKEGAKAMEYFGPDCIVAFGGGSAIDAAKAMRVLYEYPDTDFADMNMRFMDIVKRTFVFPKLGVKAKFIAVATTAGTGSEVTPFTVITDEVSGAKYPLADYELLADMAIIDSTFMMNMPPTLTAASGMDALSHALEAYASMLQTDYTIGLSLTAIKNIFKYLPIAYKDGGNEEAREKMANASAIAGMAFANSFLGICHSLAHKLGAAFKVPHGVANSILINGVIKFNATENPKKMGAFSQYPYPMAVQRYAEIATHIGLEGKTDAEKVEKLTAKISELRESVGIKKSIQECGVAEKDFLAKLDDMVEQAFDDQCTGANPRYPLIEEIKKMYLNAFYGKKEKV